MERLMQRVGLAQKAIGKLLELSCKAVFFAGLASSYGRECAF